MIQLNANCAIALAESLLNTHLTQQFNNLYVCNL